MYMRQPSDSRKLIVMLTTSLVAGGGITGGPGIMTYYYVKRWGHVRSGRRGGGKEGHDDDVRTCGAGAPAEASGA